MDNNIDPEWPFGYGYCHCGCGQQTAIARQNETAKGYVKGEPVRFLPGHYARTIEAPPVEPRFWSKITKGDGCWEWQGYTQEGYGRLRIKGKRIFAHRLSYELTYGPIPDGMYVCHHCDNPRCVRPDHLFLGTLNDNVQDAKQKGRMKTGGVLPPVRKGEANNKAKLTADKVREIRQEYQSGTSITKLGRRFGVTEQAIWAIVTRQTWKHVE